MREEIEDNSRGMRAITNSYLALRESPTIPTTQAIVPATYIQIALLLGDPLTIREKTELADCAEL